MIKTLLQFFFPHTCRICHKLLQAEGLCAPCEDCLPWLKGPCCVYCGEAVPCAACSKSPPLFSWHASCTRYEGIVRSLIHRFKFTGEMDLQGIFAKWILDRVGPRLNDSILIPIPISKKHLRKRTYHQTLLISRQIAAQTGLALIDNQLLKKRETRPQMALNKAARGSNLEDAFEWRGGSLEGKNILLIDDVYTTGATLNECAKTLLPFKPQEIGCVTLAKS